MSIRVTIRQQLAKLEDRVNARSLRERALLLTTFVMVIFILWRNLIFNYLSTKTDQIIANKERLEGQITQMQGQIETLSEAMKNDSTFSLGKKLKESILKNTRMREKINQSIAELMTSGETLGVLKNLLAGEQHIGIEKIESLEDQSIFSEKSGGLEIPGLTLYSKGIRLVLTSDYPSILVFLDKLEAAKLKVLWDSLDYRVVKYPIARITLVIHTMGTEKGWLHV